MCSKEFYDVCEYEDEDGVYISRYASALLYIENTRGCFVRALPRLALKYGGLPCVYQCLRDLGL